MLVPCLPSPRVTVFRVAVTGAEVIRWESACDVEDQQGSQYGWRTVMANERGVSPGARPWSESRKGLGVSF